MVIIRKPIEIVYTTWLQAHAIESFYTSMQTPQCLPPLVRIGCVAEVIVFVGVQRDIAMTLESFGQNRPALESGLRVCTIKSSGVCDLLFVAQKAVTLVAIIRGHICIVR
jgi:hypothetical protein